MYSLSPPVSSPPAGDSQHAASDYSKVLDAAGVAKKGPGVTKNQNPLNLAMAHLSYCQVLVGGNILRLCMGCSFITLYNWGTSVEIHSSVTG